MDTSILSEEMIIRATKKELEFQANRLYHQRSNEIFKALIKNRHYVQPPLEGTFQAEYTNVISKIKDKIKHSYFRVLFYGNIKQKDAINFINNSIKPYIDLDSNYFSKHFHLFEESDLFSYLEEQKDIHNVVIYRMKGNPNKKNSFVANYYYMGSSLNYDDHILYHLLKSTIETEVNKRLKLLNQKYNFAYFNPLGTNYYFSILVHCDDENDPKDPKDINNIVDGYIKSVETKLDSIDEKKELYKIKETLVSQMNEKEKNLNDRTEKIVQGILLNKVNFTSPFEYTIEEINKVFSKQVMIKKLNEIFRTNVKKISIQKNYSDYISMEDDGYVLNKDIPTIVTDDINYIR